MLYLIFGMLISAGDIVKRKERPGRMPDHCWGMRMTASNLFYDGYYIVLEVMTTEVQNNKGEVSKDSVCRIMDCFGRINWIGTQSLIKIF